MSVSTEQARFRSFVIMRRMPRGISLQAYLLSVGAFLIYLLSGVFAFPSPDSIPNVLLPFSILLHHDFFLGRYFDLASLSKSVPYYLHPAHGDYVDYQPGIGTSLTALPIYALYVLFGGKAGIVGGLIVGKVSAAIICGVSVGLLYVLMRKINVRPWIALMFTILYGLGSETFAVSSQGLWRHGPSELWLIVFLLSAKRIIDNPDTSRLASQTAGLAMGLLFLCRPQNFILVIPFVFLVIKKEYRKPILWSLPLLVLSVAFYDWYHMTYFHTAASTGQVETVLTSGVLQEASHKLTGALFSGLLGTTISPSRGLFVFMPWAVLSILWVRFARKGSDYRLFLVLMWLSLVAYIFMYAKLSYWTAGASFGPRYSTDALSTFAVLAAIYFEKAHAMLPRWRTRIINTLLVLFSVWSIGVQFLGTDVPRGMLWNAATLPDQHKSSVWFVKNSELAFYWRAMEASLQPASPVRHPQVGFNSLNIYGTQQSNGEVTLSPNQQYYGDVVVANEGNESWSAYPARNGEGRVRLVYSVYHDGKQVQVPGVDGTALLYSVDPGKSVPVYFSIYTPQAPGTYTYVFTLSQTGYGVFGTGQQTQNTLHINVHIPAQ